MEALYNCGAHGVAIVLDLALASSSDAISSWFEETAEHTANVVPKMLFGELSHVCRHAVSCPAETAAECVVTF
jgi:hypothetical protein